MDSEPSNLPESGVIRKKKASPGLRQAMIVRRRQEGLNNPDEFSFLRVKEQRNKYRLDSLLAEEGVLSRVAFVDLLKSVAERIKRGNVKEYVGFIVLGGDIRELKYVNEGRDEGVGGSHEMGDRIIVNVGSALAASMRPGLGDKVARIGGDELLAIMPITDPRFNENMARELMEGNGENKGRIGMVSKRIEEGLNKIRNTSEGSYLKGRGSGRLDMGWYYLTREDLVKMYNLSTSLDPAGGDFATLLQKGTERGILSSKASKLGYEH